MWDLASDAYEKLVTVINEGTSVLEVKTIEVFANSAKLLIKQKLKNEFLSKDTSAAKGCDTHTRAKIMTDEA